MRFFSDAEVVNPEPIVFVDGGPGLPTLIDAVALHGALRAIAPDRDFIYFDQRGVGLSRPSLDCAERVQGSQEVADCYERLTEVADVERYSTLETVMDLEAMRRALGYERWSLLGASYGTRVVLTALREFPDSVASAILDGVVPLQVDFFANVGSNRYRSLLAAIGCESEAQCVEEENASWLQLLSVVSDLEAEGTEGWNLKDGKMDARGFILALSALTYSAEAVHLIPDLLADAAQKDLSRWAFSSTSGGSSDGFGTHLSVQCAEELSFTTRSKIRARDLAVHQALRSALSAEYYVDYCEQWPVAPAPAVEDSPVQSDVPVLLLAGELDPVTPPAYASLAAETLSASIVAVMQGDSHGTLLGGCAPRIARRFLESPTETDLASGCTSWRETDGREAESTSELSRASSEADLGRRALQPRDVMRKRPALGLRLL